MARADKQRNRDILNIFFVLGTAIVCAGLLASVFLYYYSPSGQYLAGHTLLDPSIMEQINFQDLQPETKRKERFSFDHIEFSHANSQKSQEHFSSIPLEAYQRFYTMVAMEKSLKEANQEIQDYFIKSQPSLLTIHMRTKEGNHPGINKVFQIVQFVPEDYFRVQLHEKNEGEWAYYYQPGLYQKIMHLFTTRANL